MYNKKLESRNTGNRNDIGLRICKCTTLASVLSPQSGCYRCSSTGCVSHVNNRFNQKERLAMAIAYLETHEHLTIRQYAKMTHLSMASAEAELDAFAIDKKKPIRLVIRGKKKMYIKRQ